MSGRVLIIDDEKNITYVVHAMLERAGFDVLVYNDSAEAKKAIEKSPGIETVITDLYMPQVSGMELLAFCKEIHSQLPVVVITAHGTVESAVSALKAGAFDFITKPFDQTELLSVTRKAVETYRRLQSEPVPLDSKSDPQKVSLIVGQSPKMKEVFKLVSKIADSPSTVLIQGESGTGKELIALEIHRLSSRKDQAFVKVNCAAIPATLIESELFGYEKGAFTGAVTSKPGRFELADGGTLFLDEVAEMPLEMQVKLLRALQEQEFERVGGISTIKVDVRIIAATNRDIQKEVREGRFREDLFYRFNVVPVDLPPLRNRKEDIDLLLKTFVEHFNRKLKKSVKGVTPECLQHLRDYSWPGNIRQLENVIERMVLMSEGEWLDEEALPGEIFKVSAVEPKMEEAEGTANFKEIVRRRTQHLEKGLIEKALEETDWNVTKAAERLGLSRKGLQLKLKELDIKKKD